MNGQRKKFSISSIPLNIHEVWPHTFWGEAYRRKKIPVNHFIGHIPLLYKKWIKDQIYYIKNKSVQTFYAQN